VEINELQNTSSPDNSCPAKVVISWKYISGKHCLFFKFTGHLTEENAKEAVVRWKEEFNKSQEKNIILVWECLEMTGYDKGAREIWQTTISEFKKRIAGIYLITTFKIISAGAHFIGIVTGMNIYNVANVAELERRLAGVWDTDVK
jgi:hypothetical protein